MTCVSTSGWVMRQKLIPYKFAGPAAGWKISPTSRPTRSTPWWRARASGAACPCPCQLNENRRGREGRSDCYFFLPRRPLRFLFAVRVVRRQRLRQVLPLHQDKSLLLEELLEFGAS